jgi:hypothetical protein
MDGRTDVDVAITSVTAFSCNWTMSLLAPDGTVVTSITPCGGTSAKTGAQALSATGTYVVVVDPAGCRDGKHFRSRYSIRRSPPQRFATMSPLIGVAGEIVTITGTNLTPLVGRPVEHAPRARSELVEHGAHVHCSNGYDIRTNQRSHAERSGRH